MRASVLDGCAYAVMLGCGEHYLMAYAIAAGVSSFMVGLLVAVPLFAGALSQYIAVEFLDHPRSVKRTVVWCSLLQALSWIPILFVPWLDHSFVPLALLVTFSSYHFIGNFSLPIWNAWMGHIVPTGKLGDYFGLRNRLKAFFQLFAFVAGGLLLYYFEYQGGFVIIFVIAMGHRFLSAYYQAQMHEVKLPRLAQEQDFNFIDFIKATPRSNFAKYVLLVSLVLFATNIASPFFTVYQLRDLGFTYLEYMVSLGVTFLFQFIAFQNWGRIADRFGNLRVVRITAYLVALLPLLWLFGTNFWYILVLQALSGIFWSGFHLGAINFLFDAVISEKRAQCVAYYNMIANAAILLGALLGGFSLNFIDRNLEIFSYQITLVSPLCVLFLISSLLRFIIAGFFRRHIREVKPVETATSWQIMRQAMSLGLSMIPKDNEPGAV